MRTLWTKEEDNKCIKAVNITLKKYKQTKIFNTTQNIPLRFAWKEVAIQVNTRNSKQCADRFKNRLSPFINKTEWTQQENELLQVLVNKYSTSWSIISKHLQGRPNNMIKMQWKKLQRKQNKQTDSFTIQELKELNHLFTFN